MNRTDHPRGARAVYAEPEKIEDMPLPAHERLKDGARRVLRRASAFLKRIPAGRILKTALPLTLTALAVVFMPQLIIGGALIALLLRCISAFRPQTAA